MTGAAQAAWAEPPMLAAMAQITRELGFAQAAEHDVGALLRTLVASKPAARVLELGSGTGLSTAWLLDGMDADAHLTAVDIDATLLAVLQHHLGADPRLTVVCADADRFVPTLNGRQFDLIFADTWAGKYRVRDETLALLAPGAFYVVDDMRERAEWKPDHAAMAKRLIADLRQSGDLHIAELAWASGMIVATRRARVTT